MSIYCIEIYNLLYNMYNISAFQDIISVRDSRLRIFFLAQLLLVLVILIHLHSKLDNN